MGRPDAAREVAVARESHWRRIGRVGAGLPRPLRWLARWGHGLLGAVAGYGYRPMRLVTALAVMWLACGGLYWAAAENGAIAPSNPAVYNDPRLARCRASVLSAEPVNWTRCPELPPEHSAFSPFAYSLDLLLPFIDLRQRGQWTALDSHGAGRPVIGRGRNLGCGDPRARLVREPRRLAGTGPARLVGGAPVRARPLRRSALRSSARVTGLH